MSLYTLERSQHLPYARAEVFPFFASPENLAAITPRWRVKDKSGRTVGVEIEGFGNVPVQ